MTALAGKVAGFWRPTPTAAVSFTGEAMTQVGSTLEYYITDRAHAFWDVDHDIVVYDGVTVVTPTEIDRAGGFITLSEAPTGDVTVDGYALAMEALLGGYSWKLDPKVGTEEITTFSGTLNTEAAWKEYLGTLGEWTASCEYHWYTDGATPEVRVSADDLDLLTDSLLCMFYIDIRAASLMAISGVGILDADAVNTPIGGIVGGSLGLKGTGRLRAVSV